MADVELKSLALKKYVQKVLGKKPEENINTDDLKKIKILRLDESMLNDLLKNSSGDLIFFNAVETLSISNTDIKTDALKYLNVNLKELILVNCTGLDLQEFSKFSNINRLTAINCKDANFKRISNFNNLEVVNLANNEDLKDSDIQELWNSKNLKEVNLDGTPKITDVEHEGIQVSHKSEYRPAEKLDWNNTPKRQSKSLKSITELSPEQIEALSGESINITASDMEFLNTPDGQKIISSLSKKNTISLTLKNTAELDMENVEALKDICSISRVYVQTGWPTTQDRGYSFDTYVAIKKEISKYVEDIKNNPNLTEEQKYIEVRKRITQNISYDYAALSANQGETDYYTSRNLENGLLNGTCVCAGYADIMKNVLAELGIESKYVEGKTDSGELHAWNQVRLKGDDGKYHWYNDDVTWDAVAASCGKNEFQYCLMDDKEFSKTHRCMPERTEGFGVHSCDARPPLAARVAINGGRRHSNYEQVER